MLLSQYYINDGITRLDSLAKSIKATTDLDMVKVKAFPACFDIALGAEESYFTLAEYFFRSLKDTTIREVQRMQGFKDHEEIKQSLERIIGAYENRATWLNKGVRDFTRNIYEAITYGRRLDQYIMREVIKCVEPTERKVNIFDPRCRNGENILAIKPQFSNVATYGLESDNYQADAAKKNIDRVAKGSLVGSRISNDVFDVLLVEPPISWFMNEDAGINTTFKQEKVFTQSVLKYLRPDGVLIYVVPYFRMYKDMCLLLAKNLKNVQIRKFAGRDWFDKGLIAIVGQKANNKEPNEEIYRMLRRLYVIDEYQDIGTPFNPIALPQTTAQIEIFRGSVLDTEDMKAVVASSGCMNSFWQKQNVEKIADNVVQPLLPFNIGQIGLVLTSGCLDGTVDEGDGHYHVIKGRVSKLTTTEREVVDGNIEVNETISNRVEINVILGNGTYKVLA